MSARTRSGRQVRDRLHPGVGLERLMRGQRPTATQAIPAARAARMPTRWSSSASASQLLAGEELGDARERHRVGRACGLRRRRDPRARSPGGRAPESAELEHELHLAARRAGDEREAAAGAEPLERRAARRARASSPCQRARRTRARHAVARVRSRSRRRRHRPRGGRGAPRPRWGSRRRAGERVGDRDLLHRERLPQRLLSERRGVGDDAFELDQQHRDFHARMLTRPRPAGVALVQQLHRMPSHHAAPREDEPAADLHEAPGIPRRHDLRRPTPRSRASFGASTRSATSGRTRLKMPALPQHWSLSASGTSGSIERGGEHRERRCHHALRVLQVAGRVVRDARRLRPASARAFEGFGPASARSSCTSRTRAAKARARGAHVGSSRAGARTPCTSRRTLPSSSRRRRRHSPRRRRCSCARDHARCARRPRVRGARRSSPGAAVGRIVHPFAVSMRSVARFTPAKSPSITQPSSNDAVPRSPVAVGIQSRRGWAGASRRASRRASPSEAVAGGPSTEATPRARVTRAIASAGRRSQARAKVASTARAIHGQWTRPPRASRARLRADGRRARRSGRRSHIRGSRGIGRGDRAPRDRRTRPSPSRSARINTSRPRGESFSSSSAR